MFFVPLNHPAAGLSQAYGRSVSRLLDDSLFDHHLAPASANATDSRSPTLDVTESETGYTVTLDMPGISKDDVKISIDGRRVTVQAQTPASDDKPAAGRVLYRERAQARYTRSLRLPQAVDQAESNARIEHGVLTLTLAKRNANPAQSLAVN